MLNLGPLGEILYKLNPKFLIAVTKTIELIIYYGHLPTKLNTGVIYLLNTDIEIYCYSILLIIFILINYRKKN